MFAHEELLVFACALLKARPRKKKTATGEPSGDSPLHEALLPVLAVLEAELVEVHGDTLHLTQPSAFAQPP